MPAAATKQSGKKTSEYAPPPLPANLDPASTHQYYMQMADYHDKQAWKHNRLGRIKPLWSSARNQHDDNHTFHRAMRDGFAQKALAVDLASPMGDEGAVKKGFGESLDESRSSERILVAHDVYTLEEFEQKYGRTPVDALRTGQVDCFTILGEGKQVPPGTADRSARRLAVQMGDVPARPSRVPKKTLIGSCWGCGSDWMGRLHQWQSGPNDDTNPLIQMSRTGKYNGGKLCPDCYEEEGSPEMDVRATSGRKRAPQSVSIADLRPATEAFGGIDPTSALATINGNKTNSAAPLKTNFPTAAGTHLNPTSKTSHTSVKPMESTEAVARGASVDSILRLLLK